MKANYRALYLIADNLADLYEDGIPLTLSLELLLELPINKEYKKSLMDVKNNIIKGESLGKSFNKNSRLYPDLFCGIVDIGESSGELSAVLRSLKEFYFNTDKVRRQIKSSIRYPLFIFFILIIACIMFLIFIVPTLYESFSAMNKGASNSIEYLYKIYAFIRDNKIYSLFTVISGLLAVFIFYKYIRASGMGRYSGILLKIKFFSQYYEYIFMVVLSIIMSSGIEISRGIDLCIKSIEIQCVKRAMEQLKEEILLGNEIAETIKKIKYISSYSVSMIYIGEKGGNIDEVLEKASKRLENNLLRRLEKMVSYVMPSAIILVSSLIIVFIFIFIVPMLDMIYSGVI